MRLSKYVKVLCAVLVLQVVGLLALSRDELKPETTPLAEFSRQVGGYATIYEGVVEPEVQEVLRADDTLTRVYASPEGQQVSLFIAYFESQRTGKSPHSPKNCLPGSGWVPGLSDTISIEVAERSTPIEVNRYLVSRGDATSVVLYWYQSRDRVIASEYFAKIFLVLDSMKHNRSDTAMVRIVIPVRRDEAEKASEIAADFAKSLYGSLSKLPQFQPI